MTKNLSLATTPENIKALQELLEWWRKRDENTLDPFSQDLALDTRPPVRFIMHEPYSTYVLKKYQGDSYDLDGDRRTGQYYAVMVDGDAAIPVSLFDWDPDGNTKQMIEFRGDDINGSIKLVLNDHETAPISLLAQDLTEESLTEKLEALPDIGKDNVKVSIWPGNWLIEFVGELSGEDPGQFVIDLPENAVFDCWSYYTDWRDSGEDDEIRFPYPLTGTFDTDDDQVNDAVAAGSIGFATMVPGVGLMVFPAQCREYNGDGTPDL